MLGELLLSVPEREDDLHGEENVKGAPADREIKRGLAEIGRTTAGCGGLRHDGGHTHKDKHEEEEAVFVEH